MIDIDIGLELFGGLAVLLDFVLARLDNVSEELDLVGDIAEAARVLRQFRILVEGATFQFADFLVLFAEHRLLFLKFVVHAGIFGFGALGGIFGSRKFGIRIAGRLGLVDTAGRLFTELFQLRDTQVAGRHRILLDRNRGIASKQGILHFADVVVQGGKQLLFLVPLVWFLPKVMDIKGIWYSYPVSDIMACTLTLCLLVPLLRKFKTMKDGDDPTILGSTI